MEHNKNHKFAPESLMMSHGYNPKWSEGAIKSPIFQTSTFVFNSAEEGKAFFELAYGLRERGVNESPGLIYSRLNNPNLEILENRLCLWDKAEDCAVFESGMSAISTVLLEFLKPGDVLLHSSVMYGGTDHFIHHFLKKIGVESIAFNPGDTEEEIINLVNSSGKADKLTFVFIETPANPTDDLFDIAMCKRVARHFSNEEKEIYVAVDNTYMGPLWCHPLEHGSDLVIYSATKYIGGHSDLIAGAVLGSHNVMQRVRTLRTFLGNMAGPHTCWLLMRSLETLQVRMNQQMLNAQKIAAYLNEHSKVERVHYLGLLQPESRDYAIYKKQYTSPGAMISFDIEGGESQAFQFLNHLQLFKIAVSLGSTEGLAQHPASMTHAGVDPKTREVLGVTDQLVRLSIGVENVDDILWDIEQALLKVQVEVEVDVLS